MTRKSSPAAPPASEASRPVSTVAIIDDHRGFSDRLATFVDAVPGWTVVGKAEDAVAGLVLLRTSCPDVALVDIGLQGRNGFWLTEHALRSVPTLRVILMSDGEPEEYAEAAVLAGAVAYVPKRAISQELPELLRVCLDPSSVGRGSSLSVAPGLANSRLPDGGPSSAGSSATTFERSSLRGVDLVLAGAALMGFAAAGQVAAGALLAVIVILISHRRWSPPRARRGQAEGRESQRIGRNR
jgi:DNA-binding NarL/FixJ family response regulator